MDEDEEIIRQFFNEIKNRDLNLTVPNYQQRTKSYNWPVICSIAAVITLVIAFNWSLLYPEEPIQEVEIVVDNSNSMQTNSLLTSDRIIEEWQSPTQSLIDDF